MGINVKNMLGATEESTEEALDRIAKTYKLGDKMKRFVYEYTRNGGNKTQALLEAGYLSDSREIIEDRSNKSEAAKRARQSLSLTGYRLLNHKKVTNALEEFAEVFKSSVRGDVEKDVYRIARLRATYDIADAIDVLNSERPEEIVQSIKELPEEIRLSIDSITYKYYGKDADRFAVEIKYADRQRSIEFLSKLAGLMVDRKEVRNIGDSMPTINIAVMNQNEEKKAKKT